MQKQGSPHHPHLVLGLLPTPAIHGPLNQERTAWLGEGQGMRTGRIRILTSSHRQKEDHRWLLPNQLWEPRSTQGSLPQEADVPPLMSPKLGAWPQPVLQHFCPWGQDVSPILPQLFTHGRGGQPDIHRQDLPRNQNTGIRRCPSQCYDYFY